MICSCVQSFLISTNCVNIYIVVTLFNIDKKRFPVHAECLNIWDDKSISEYGRLKWLFENSDHVGYYIPNPDVAGRWKDIVDMMKSLGNIPHHTVSLMTYEFDTFVAHNVPFDRSCLQRSAELYRIHLPKLNWMCSLQTARKIYSFTCNSLDYLCEQLDIPMGTHHRAGADAEMCARLFLRELEDIYMI